MDTHFNSEEARTAARHYAYSLRFIARHGDSAAARELAASTLVFLAGIGVIEARQADLDD